MKRLLFVFLFFASLGGYAQTYTDTQLQQHQDSVLRGNNANNITHPQGRELLKRIVDNKLNSSAYNRVTDYGSTPVMTPDSIFYANVKVKFGNSAEITVSGHTAIVAPDADPVNYRVDYLVVNRNGTVQVVTGSPGVAGLSPNIDPNNQVMVYWWVINNTGIGTVTPVTYATLPQTRAGVATNLSINPYTFITVTQEMIDDALAGIVTGGGGSGHTLKNNGTTLTQRGTLQVLSDATIMRDSSATTSSILDLRNYLSRLGGTRPWQGEQQVSNDGVLLYTPDYLGSGLWSNFHLGQGYVTMQATNDGSGSDAEFLFGATGPDFVVNVGNNQTILRVTKDSVGILSYNSGGLTTKGFYYNDQYFSAGSIAASTNYDKFLPTVKVLKDYVAAHSGGGGSVPTKILRDTTNTSANTLKIIKESAGAGLLTQHTPDLFHMEMYGGSYVSPGSTDNPYFHLERGDNRFVLGGSANDFRGLDGDQAYWLVAGFNANSYSQKGYVDLAITNAMSGGSVGTTTNALSAGTGLEYITGTTFNGSAARTLRLSTGAAAANLGFTPVSNVLSSGNIIVGSAGNVATPATMSGFGTLSNTGVLSLVGGSITGTGGAGFIGLIPQTSTPSTPASGVRQYANSAGAWSWIGVNGFTRTWSAAGLTGNRTYTLPDLDGTITVNVQATDIEITDLTKGIILKSPDGTRWRITIDNTGAITTTSL